MYLGKDCREISQSNLRTIPSLRSIGTSELSCPIRPCAHKALGPGAHTCVGTPREANAHLS